MTPPKALLRLNKHMDANKLYYSLLEITIVIGVLYFLALTDLLNMPWITFHISNLIGTIILMLLIVGPGSFRAPERHKLRIGLSAIILVAINFSLELSQSIGDINLPYFHWVDFNTSDIIDAYFGTAGVVIIMMVLYFFEYSPGRHTKTK